MADLNDGESVEMKGSGAKPYVLKNVGGVYSCTCPAWRNQSIAIERRTCKHLRKLRGDAAEEARIGLDVSPVPGPDGEEGASEEKTGPPLLLAERWDNAQDLAGWWLSEKLDGVRAYWDGKSLISRLGNRFHAPDWFLEGLPEIPLDGELWIGRKAFQRTVGHRPPAGQDRPVEAGPLRRLRRAGCRRRVRGPSCGRPHARRAAPAAVPGGPRARDLHGLGPPPRGAGAGRGARRRRADAPPAGIALRGRPVADAVEGQELPRRRGAGAGAPQRGRPAQGTARRAARGAGRRDAVLGGHRLLRRRTRRRRRRSAPSSPSATRSFPTAACPGSRPTSACGATPPGLPRRRPLPQRSRRSRLQARRVAHRRERPGGSSWSRDRRASSGKWPATAAR